MAGAANRGGAGPGAAAPSGPEGAAAGAAPAPELGEHDTVDLDAERGASGIDAVLARSWSGWRR
jgi:hypothetical protein